MDTDNESCGNYERRFSDRLRFLRNKKNFSAREMSIALGQNVNYINLIENGKRFPSLRGFFAICDCLGCPPREFFSESAEPSGAETEFPHRALGGAEQSVKSKEASAELLHIYFSLAEPQRNLLLSVAAGIQRCLWDCGK
ncbi:MAG: helix-turn-helix domain-containing protein [Bacteroides sp.]|nr:helix-turn-helix domain-containing protein [Prevotella sp.]MCM1407098.1 helix-turn-helix domain-containing protein [Treponema brennaborense]MCM1470250.1 helix-turn-helix domain-containing protein [Bacteroides sp.]